MALGGLPIGVRVGIGKVTRVLLVVLAVLLALTFVGVDLTALTVIGGAVGIGLGFGLQRIASNFISGFVLLGDRSILRAMSSRSVRVLGSFANCARAMSWFVIVMAWTRSFPMKI